MDGLPIIELSKRTGLAKTTLTSMLDRMEGRGFLERVADHNDRRVLRIFLTAKAKVLSDQYNKVSDEMSQIFYKDFSDEEIAAFEKTLEKILNNLSCTEGKRDLVYKIMTREWSE